MLPLNCDGLPQRYDCNGLASDRSKKTINIPADLAMRDSNVIDTMIAAVFDLLGSCTVELRVSVESNRRTPPKSVLPPSRARMVTS